MKRLYLIMFLLSVFYTACNEENPSDCDSMRQDSYVAYIAFSEEDSNSDSYVQLCQDYVSAYENVLDEGCAGYTQEGLDQAKSFCIPGYDGGDGGGDAVNNPCDTGDENIRANCLLGKWALDSVYRVESYYFNDPDAEDTTEIYINRYRIFYADNTTCEIYSPECECNTEPYEFRYPGNMWEEIRIGEYGFGLTQQEYEEIDLTETSLIMESQIWEGGQPVASLRWFYRKIENIEGCDDF